jgi:O-methyltransferase
MKQIVGSLVNSLGLEIRRKRSRIRRSGHYGLGYDLEAEAYENILKILSHTMVGYERLITLYQQAVFCEHNDIAGSFVECGTWKGGAVGLMALANLKHGSKRRELHLFDSFEGVPEPDAAVDGQSALEDARQVGGGTGGKLVPIPLSVGTLEANKELLEQTIGYDASRLRYHKGWFQDTLPAQADTVGNIAILRLDCDWYASTKICLDYLYDKVLPGGFVIIDDYGNYEGCRKAVDEFLQARGNKAYLNHIDATGRYLIKP